MSTTLLVTWLALSPLAAPNAAATSPAAKAAAAKPAAKPAAQAAPQAQKPAAQPVVVAQAAPAPVAAAVVAPPPPEPVVESAAPAPPQTAAPQAPAPAQTPDWLTQNEAQTQAAEPMQRWPLIVAFLLMLAAGGAFLTLRVRQGQTFWPGGVSGHAIEILAVKTLGHKHRLVLIEASGERLLLAATEREVRLLSHISSHEGMAIDAQSDAHQVDALTRGMGQTTRQTPMTSSSAYVAPEQPRVPAAAPTEAATSPYVNYIATETAPAPMVAPAGPASHESLSAEALYEGAARSMDLDEQDDDLDDAQSTSAQESPDALASDVAGLARWRQAAAQGAETWGKQV